MSGPAGIPDSGIASGIASWIGGFLLPYRALHLIFTRRKLLALSLVPIIITTALYVLIFFWLEHWLATSLREWTISWEWPQTSWGAPLAWMLAVLGKLALFLSMILTFTFGASVVATPFNDFLAEASEKLALPPLSPVRPPSLALRLRLILIDIAKSLIVFLMAPFLFVGSWIPGLNILVVGATWLLITYQYIAYPQTRRGEGVGAACSFLFRHFHACLGMGASLFALFSIPFLSPLVLPVAVVSGTLLVARAPGSASLSRWK